MLIWASKQLHYFTHQNNVFSEQTWYDNRLKFFWVQRQDYGYMSLMDKHADRIRYDSELWELLEFLCSRWYYFPCWIIAIV
jgi:hypothetical protein